MKTKYGFEITAVDLLDLTNITLKAWVLFFQIVARCAHFSNKYEILFPKRFEEIIAMLENESSNQRWKHFKDVEEKTDLLLRIEFLLRAGKSF